MKPIWNGTKKPIRSSIQEMVEWIDDIPIYTVTLEFQDYKSKEEEEIFKDTLKSMPKSLITIDDFDDFYERLIITAVFRNFNLDEEDL